MTKTPIWARIHGDLCAEFAEGLYRPGEKLPTEAALAARFGVNRHTIRQALAQLGRDGLVRSRRGSGVYVADKPSEYPISIRPRFHETVSALGRLPSREISRIETRRAAIAEAEALGLAAEAPVHVVEGLALIDGIPVAAFRSVFDAARFPALPAVIGRTASITAALTEGGAGEYTRARTRIGAELASGPRALALRLTENAPLLRSEALNVDAEGRPVEYGLAWFAAERVTLTVQGEPR